MEDNLQTNKLPTEVWLVVLGFVADDPRSVVSFLSTNKFWSKFDVPETLWAACVIESSKRRFALFHQTNPSFYYWEKQLTENSVLERRSLELSLTSARATLFDLRRICYKCGTQFTLASIREEECKSHCHPFYWGHKTESWDGGGTSWDEKGYPCCRAEEYDAPPCVKTVHMEYIHDEQSVADVIWDDLYPDEGMPPLIRFSTEYHKHVQTLIETPDTEDQRSALASGEWYQVSDMICPDCHYHPCACQLYDLGESFMMEL